MILFDKVYFLENDYTRGNKAGIFAAGTRGLPKSKPVRPARLFCTLVKVGDEAVTVVVNGWLIVGDLTGATGAFFAGPLGRVRAETRVMALKRMEKSFMLLM